MVSTDVPVPEPEDNEPDLEDTGPPAPDEEGDDDVGAVLLVEDAGGSKVERRITREGVCYELENEALQIYGTVVLGKGNDITVCMGHIQAFSDLVSKDLRAILHTQVMAKRIEANLKENEDDGDEENRDPRRGLPPG